MGIGGGTRFSCKSCWCSTEHNCWLNGFKSQSCSILIQHNLRLNLVFLQFLCMFYVQNMGHKLISAECGADSEERLHSHLLGFVSLCAIVFDQKYRQSGNLDTMFVLAIYCPVSVSETVWGDQSLDTIAKTQTNLWALLQWRWHNQVQNDHNTFFVICLESESASHGQGRQIRQGTGGLLRCRCRRVIQGNKQALILEPPRQAGERPQPACWKYKAPKPGEWNKTNNCADEWKVFTSN